MKNERVNCFALTRLLACAVLVALGGGLSSARAQSASNNFWQSQNIYQLMTDRFFDGDPANNNASGSYAPASSGAVHGGDFKGIEQKLDYLKALGATAIWISPIVLNANGEFHGYAGRDFYQVDPHWGSLSNLQHFVQAAHARGLLVIDDIVVNHGADLIYSADAGYGNFVYPPAGYRLKYYGAKTYPAPFALYNATYTTANNQLTNLFHNSGAIQNYGDVTQVQLGELSGLDDFRTESAYVRSNMAAIYRYWIQAAGFDGFRIDTVKHVDTGFWQTWCPAVHAFAATNGLPNFFMFGEVYDGDEALCGSYTGTQGGGPFLLDSVVDYPLYFTVNSVFATASGSTKPIEDHYHTVDANYDASAQMRLVTFLDNHDQARFLSSGTTDRLAVALAFLYTARGIPCLYYGTEQAFNGTTDPNDREDMFAGQFEQGPSLGDNFNFTHPLFQLVAKLNNFRRLYPALTLGSHVNQWNDPNGPGLFAYARRLGTQEVFVVFNTASSPQTLPGRTTIYAPGTVLVNLFDTNETFTVLGGAQTPPISVPSTTAKVFIAQAQWRSLDPVVTLNAPAHDQAAVPTWSPVVLQFSQPMDTNSVQAAFSVSPPVSGTFSWSAAHDTLTFTADGAGLAPLTTCFVRVTNTAFAAASGQTLFAPYELKFKTAAFSIHDVAPPWVMLATPTNGAVISGALNLSGSATDNVAVAKVEFQLDGNGWLSVSGTSSWSAGLNSSNFLNGPHQLSVRATDTAGNLSVTNTVAVKFFNVPGNYVQRLSGGNPASVTDCSANAWLKDTNYVLGGFGYVGGTGGFVANTVSGICAGAQSLYQREHFSTDGGGFFYQFDCPPGIYETTLLEAETYWSAVGQRVFNVFIQGQHVLTNFDILAAAGGPNLPLSLTFTNTVTNAQLRILFTPVVDNARVSGVQVRKIADVFSDTDGIPDWWRLAYFGHALGAAADASRAGDDADGDGVSNLTEFLHGADPRNASSVPAAPSFNLAQIILTNGGVRLGSGSATNWTFQLQRRDTLVGGVDWSNLNAALPGTGGLIWFTDPTMAANAARLYRIQAR